MQAEEAIGMLDQRKRELSCELADGLIDDLVPYWDRVEEAFDRMLSDERCVTALRAIRDDEEACDRLVSESPFLEVLMSRSRSL